MIQIDHKPLPKLLTLKEAASLLKCHPNTLRLWDKDGTLPMIRFGNRKAIRYNQEDITKLLDRQTYNSAVKESSLLVILEFLEQHAKKCYQESLKLTQQTAATSASAFKPPDTYRDLHIALLSNASAYFNHQQVNHAHLKRQGMKLANIALKNKLPMEAVIRHIILLKETIRTAIEQAGIFAQLTAKDVLTIGHQLNALYDVLIATIATACYQNFKDNSERTTASLQRREAELRYQLQINRTIAESTATLLFVSDKDGNIAYINPEAEKVFGYTLADLQGKSLHEIIHYKYPDGTPFPIEQCPLGHVFADGKPVRNYEGVFFDKQANELHMICSNMPILENGQVVGEVLAMHNITVNKKIDALVSQQKLTEDKVLRQTALLNALVQGTQDAVYIKNKESELLLVNPITAQIFNKTESELIGTKDLDLLTDKEAEEIRKTDLRIMKTGQPEVIEETVSIKGELHTFLSTKSPFVDHQGKTVGIIGVSRDITERKQLEVRKDDFISMASHELKTPVTSIKALAQALVVADLLPREKQKMYLQKINIQINRLTQLITDMLDVSKIQNGKLNFSLQVCDFDTLVADTIETIQQTCTSHTIELTGHTKQMITVDPDRITQVLINLLTNAIKYSPTADRVVCTLSTTATMVCCTIQDFGIGIPKKDLDKIFQRFYRVTGEGVYRSFPGLGIGLYISQEIVLRHGGKLTVTSNEAQGSSFTISLPIKPNIQ